ncbi:MAG: AAA family ATPase [Gemmataceae bacterium]
MDFSAFGLSQRPFRSTPDTEAYYAAAGHEAALADLREAYEHGDDGALLTGDAGMGKTLLAHRFLDWLPDETRRMLLPSAKYAKPADLHQAILFDLGQPWQGRSEQEMRLAVTEHFLGELAADHRTAIVIDEAQHLSADAIEELRLLANVAKPTGRATFVLLAGLPTLRDRLETPWLAAAAQRFRTRAQLEPLSERETMAYLWHQLEACGSRDPERLLNEESAEMIADLSRGVPRLINHLAATSLSLSAAAEGTEVDLEAVLEAGERLGLHPAHEDEADSPASPAFSESSEESLPGTLSILPSGREPLPGRPPKLKTPKRRSA